MHPILDIVRRQKAGVPEGIFSCCSSNKYVILAVLERAKRLGVHALVESTANQVDQFGGYSGMKPEDFHGYVLRLASEAGYAENRVILGGDHLGPLTWSGLDASLAMDRAEELVRSYVISGYTKIHIDTSMRLSSDDPRERLSDETIASRGARLAKAAEEAYAARKKQFPDACAPVYVIGSEVPIPGGAQEAENGVQVTSPEDCRNTLEIFERTFRKNGLDEAWERVAAAVVQPGVEFSDSDVFEYDREAARELMSVIKDKPIVFEGHSTDYQTPDSLRRMVEDGIAILKVGPALTFALREALFALENIEKELLRGSGIWMSDFRDTLEYAMQRDDKNWRKHYHGDGNAKKLARSFSFSDRARYYLPLPEVGASIGRLVKNLGGTSVPLSLLSQYMPVQYTRVRSGSLESRAEELIKDRIGDCIDEYLYATVRTNKSRSMQSNIIERNGL